jgi:protein SDA1
MLYKHIVNDIKRINQRKRDERVNRTLQNFMYTMLQDPNPIAVRMSLQVMIDLFRKGVWNDVKTVNAISTAVFSKDPKVVQTMLQFFLSPPSGEELDFQGDDNEYRRDRREVLKKYGHGAVRKTNKRKKKLRRMLAELSKKRKGDLDQRIDDRRSYNHPALVLIHDPQGYSEKVYGVLARSTEKFEVRILLMNFLSRLINCHQLVLLDFYSLLLKYIQPHQQFITQILAIAAQGCHPLVTPEAIEPVIMAVVNQFVTDRRPPEALAVGLNTVRELCLRCPLAMTPTLLKDLIQYKNHKEKGVAMGAKSLVTLFRILNPAILPKKYRAKGLDMSVKPQAYGAVDVKDHLEGTELLDQYDSLMEDSDDDDMSGSDDDMDVDSNDEWESASGSDLDGEEDLAGGEWESVSDDESGAGSADEEDGEEESGEEGMISGDEMDEDEESDEEGSVDEFRSRSDVSSDDDGEVGADEIEEPSASDAKSTGTSNTSRVESLRILDDEDLRRLAILREKRHELEAMSAQRKKNKKRARDEMTSNLEEARERDVNPEDLEGPQKRTKMDREARIEHAKESRDEIKAERGDKRQDKKSRFKTNKEKNKTKLFKMVQYSDRVRSKKNLTVKEKVARRGKHLENVKKLDKSKKSKILKR